MTVPGADLCFVVFDDCHPSDAVDTFCMPDGEVLVIYFLSLAFSYFVGDVVVHSSSSSSLKSSVFERFSLILSL